MRVLWVKAGKLLPVDTGGKIRSYNLLRRLSEQNEVVLLSYYGGRADPAYDAAIIREFPGALPMVVPAPFEGGVGAYLGYARRFLRPAPFAVSKFTSRRVKQALNRCLGEERFDVAVCDFLS